ncbi:anti-FecI sigma factor, FecR [Pseudopedobacter saltans DSM 12145]|uniref:Anti-FecI sigma factor, FecR n=1 Tax=Pseudopedobacter saltans (strain ATCC 51119 / DSM 12145 / JCM 21818 / CCUG 39354 / LMG 10337 / NBRC 100064 / NCIMB 13643) TaxID=762903 RepID=F0SCR9_PSESL|nr:FecR family protein [Pseudopedobacter saltans]ADY50658.1 anti-FecI sigma factor, FecR [Pseudopedobacter saltans DSM 12145]
MQNFDDFDKIFRISDLVVKYIRKELNMQEQSELNQWIESDSENKALFERLVKERNIEEESNLFSTGNKQQAWQNIMNRTEGVELKHRRGSYMKYAAAIAFLILSFFAVIKFKLFSGENLLKESQVAKVEPTEIFPGGNKAVLTLGDGSRIVLDSLKDGNIAEQLGGIVKKTKEGQIVYDLSDITTKIESQKLVYNTVSTPKGGEYQLTLPDGTKVWLNSMSTLKFPVVFAGNERKVELTGEAYFEVAKDKTKPFFVQAKDTKVQVLGTHFNISAFADETEVRTTLLEGSVKVDRGMKTIVLVPGQEASASDSKVGFTVREADLEKVMAWKNGYFVFRDEPLESLMKRISRWYNIEVDYKGDMGSNTFGGKFSKNSTLSELLRSLELTGTVKFKTQERRVTVMQ